MSAPYPLDPHKANAPVAGWANNTAPANAPYPTAPAHAPYPTAPANAPYPIQPGYVPSPNPYPMQPVGTYPTHPPPPYTDHAAPVGLPAGTCANPVYNASSGSFPTQAGNRPENVPKDDVLPDQFGSSFSDKAIRHAFVRKVYLILMAQLLVTLGFVSLFTFHVGVKRYVQRNIWIYFLSYAVFLVTYLTLVCCSGVRRHWPGNFIMLSIFTLALSYMTGTIASTYDTDIVIMTVGITCAICFLISLFATQTKYDFTGCGTYLFVAGMVLFIFGIITIFTYNHILNTIYSAGIALLFSMYLVFDTQMIIGGRKHEMSPEEHIYGAVSLYLDVIYIFLALLSIFGGGRE